MVIVVLLPCGDSEKRRGSHWLINIETRLVSFLVDTVWKELSQAVRYSGTQPPNMVLILMHEYWKPLVPSS